MLALIMAEKKTYFAIYKDVLQKTLGEALSEHVCW